MPEVSETITCWISRDLVGEAGPVSILAPATLVLPPGLRVHRAPLTQSGCPRPHSGSC